MFYTTDHVNIVQSTEVYYYSHESFVIYPQKQIHHFKYDNEKRIKGIHTLYYTIHLHAAHSISNMAGRDWESACACAMLTQSQHNWQDMYKIVNKCCSPNRKKIL